MALALKDRVKETTIVVGTGAATLLGSSIGFQPFSVVGNGNTTYYCISDQFGSNWEVGIGTYSSSGNTLARTTVLASSNGGALVVFTAGVKDVFVTYPAEKGVWLDASNNAIGLGTPAAFVGTNITGTASGLTAGNVTTNANLTGAVTSTGNATSLGSFTSAQLAAALTDETGTGANVFATSPTLVTPALGTPTSGTLTNCTLPQLSASTGSTLVGTTNGGTGSVTRTVASKLNETVSVKDFGAVGDGVTDDYASINAAITYATANTLTVYFPAGYYKITQGLVFNQYCGCMTDGSASIYTASTSITVITFTYGNYGYHLYQIPAIVGGAIGLLLYGANLVNVTVPNIQNSISGLVLQIDNTYKSCADNIVNFTSISGCSDSGIKFINNATSSSGLLMQGNTIFGNFITVVKYAIQFYDSNGGLFAVPWDCTEIKVAAIDCAGVTGSIGLYGNPAFPPGSTLFDIRTFFGGMATFIQGYANNNIFKLAFQGLAAYAQINLGGVGNVIINKQLGQTGARGVTTPVSLSNTTNTIATFNGGVVMTANRFLASLSVGVTLSNVIITGTAGQFQCNNVTGQLAVGQPILITGTFGGTGSITGYVTGTTYYVINTNGISSFTLSATLGGTAITTTTGTPTGLTYAGGLAAGQQWALNFFHPFIGKYGPKVTAEPLWTIPLVIINAVENSTTGAGLGYYAPATYQGMIVYQALSAVAAGSYNLYITIHNIP